MILDEPQKLSLFRFANNDIFDAVMEEIEDLAEIEIAATCDENIHDSVRAVRAGRLDAFKMIVERFKDIRKQSLIT